MTRHFIGSAVLACTLAAGVSVHAQEPPAAPSSSCPVAEDGDYAYTKDHPVQVGGSPVYGEVRQRRYLDALRGPAGQPVRYKLKGTVQAPDGTLLDPYEVSYEGLEKPVTIFLDWYHYYPQRAPRGFICGQPFNLGAPPVGPFQESDDIRALALAQGATRDFAPIPLDLDGSSTHGVLYDRFRMLARAAREAARAGKTIDLKNPPRDLVDGMVVLAYAVPCEGRPVQVTAIDVVAANGAAIPRANMVQTTNIKRLLPGVEAPEGSLAAIFQLANPRQRDSIRITYAEGCGSTSNVISLPTTVTPGRAVQAPAPPLPAGAPANQPVFLQTVLDLDGVMQRPSYVGGPAALMAPAIESISQWKSEPARINGAPVPVGVMLQVKFVEPK